MSSYPDHSTLYHHFATSCEINILEIYGPNTILRIVSEDCTVEAVVCDCGPIG